jgi:hypothetical protein
MCEKSLTTGRSSRSRSAMQDVLFHRKRDVRNPVREPTGSHASNVTLSGLSSAQNMPIWSFAIPLDELGALTRSPFKQ